MSASKRYLETEYEEARKRQDLKRQRQQLERVQRRLGKSDCELCLEEFCCGGASTTASSSSTTLYSCLRVSSCCCCCWCLCRERPEERQDAAG